MSDMFKNYEYIPSSYIPTNRKPKKPTPTYVAPFEEYNVKGEFIGFAWNREDSVVLEFTTEGEATYGEGYYETAEDYLDGKIFTFTLYDFLRGEICYQESFYAGADVELYIDNTDMAPGTYRGSLTVKDEDGTCYTLIDTADYLFRVK